MAYCAVHQSLINHRKLVAAAEILGMEEVHLMGHLVSLWIWCLDNAPGGILPESIRAIAKGAQWDREPALFTSAMKVSGFFDVADTGHFIIHDWDQGGGKLEATRKLTAERVRRFRERNATSNDDVTESNALHPVTCNAPVTHIEKSREEKNIEENTREREETRAHSRPPSLEAFLSQAKRVGIDTLAAEKCWNHYEINGWPNGGAKWDLVLKNWNITDVQRKQDQIPSRNGGGGKSSRCQLEPWMIKYGEEEGLSQSELMQIDWAPLIKSGRVKR